MTPPAILLIDDEDSIRTSLRIALEYAGYVVLEAANGLEAEGIYRNFSVSLVITDLATPERNGIETIVALRREFPNLPVLAMSGESQSGVPEAALLLGARAVVDKPVAVPELLTTVRRVLEECAATASL